MTGIITSVSSLWVFMMMASLANARVINKRAAFYIANDTMCIVDGEVYFNGDPVPTDDHCEKCTCRPPGFSCVLRDCDVKPGCKAVRKDGECCPDYVCGCSHNGNVYRDGDFIRDLQNPCYTCRCHGSSISCTFADCLFRSDCGPEYVQGECCPRYDHCPPLSTTQKTTTVITTVPITYDETTMPLFNLTSPPHERQATHTTIFPTTGTVILDGEAGITGTVTLEDGEAATTGTYGTQGHSLFTLEPAPTTHIFDHTVASSSDTPEIHIAEIDTSAVTISDSEHITEETSQVYDTSSHKVISGIADGADSTSVTSDAMSSEKDDAESEDVFNDISSDSTIEELSSETQPVTEVSDGGQKDHTELKLKESTMMPIESTMKTDETTTVRPDEISTDETREKTDETTVKSDESTMKSEETTVKVDETTVTYDEVIMEAETATLTAEESTLKDEETTSKEDEETTLRAEKTTLKSEETTLKSEETTLKADDTTRIPFSSEEPLKVTSFITEKVKTFSTVEESKDGIIVTTTDKVTSKDFVTSSGGEDESYSRHETFSVVTEVQEISESTTPSPLSSTVTMSGDSDTELFPLAAFATIEVDGTATDEIHKDSDISEAPSSAITSHDGSQTELKIKDGEIPSSTEHSDFPESASSTTASETETHTISTGATDHSEYTDGIIDEDEISTQDAEELDSFLEEIISSHENIESGATVFEDSSHLPSSETAGHTQAATSEFTGYQSIGETGIDLHTVKTETSDDDDGRRDTVTFADSPKETVYTQSVPTEHDIDSRKHTTEQPVYDSSVDIYTEKTSSSDEKEEEDIDSLLSSILEESETEKLLNETRSTLELLLDHDHTLSESETDAVVTSTTQSVFEDQEAPENLPERVNTSSVEDVAHIQDEDIHTETQGSSLSSLLATTDGSTESVIIMEAETDPSFITSEASPTIASDTDTSKISYEDTKSPEILTTAVHGLKSPATLIAASSPTSPDISTFGNHESTTNRITEGHFSTESEEEHENILETSSAVSPEQETSDFHQDNGVLREVTEISAQDSNDSEGNRQVNSTHFEADQSASAKTSTSDNNERISENTVTVYSTESADPKVRNTVALTTGPEERETSSESLLTDEVRFTDANDQTESPVLSTVLTPDDFNNAEGTHEEQKDRGWENGMNTTPQGSTDEQATEAATEITMDAEESTVNHSFETGSDYHFTTESVEKDYFSTAEDVASLDNEHSDSVNRYTLDGETGDYHLRVSRSTSLNSMFSSATERYPQEPELQHGYSSKTEKEGTETVGSTGTSTLVSDNTAVTNVHSDSVTKSITLNTAYENLDPTHDTYLEFAETANPTFDSDEDFTTTLSNSSEHEHAGNLTAHEIIGTILGDTQYKDNKTDVVSSLKETSDDEKLLSTLTTAILQSTKPATALTYKILAPDLISTVEHHVSAVSIDLEETEKPTSIDGIAGVTQSFVTDAAKSVTSEINGIASTLENSETEREYFSENYYTNSAIERESDEDASSRFSRTSERYATSAPVVYGNDFSDSSTENHPTMNSFTMDAETADLDDITERNVEQTKEQTTYSSSWNTQSNSEPTNVFESKNIHSENDSDSEKEFVGKDFESGPEKGGELFEPTVPVLSAIEQNVEVEGQNSSDSEKEFVGKEFQSWPGKGGEWFEPTVAVLSIINVQKDKSETSLGDLTTVGYSVSSTNLKTDVSSQTDETSHPVNKTGEQAEEILDIENLYHTTLPTGVEYSELTTVSNGRDFTNSVDETHVDNRYTREVIPHETTRPDNLEHHINTHESFHFPAEENELEAIQQDSEVNAEDTTVSAKLTFSAAETAENSSDKMNVTVNKENDELVEKVTVQTQITDDEAIHEDAADEHLKHESGEATTTEKYNSPATDETGSATRSDTEKRVVTDNDELVERPERHGELTMHSEHHEAENADSQATKEPDVLTNEYMLSDWPANDTDFTDILVQEAEPTTDHVSAAMSTVPEGEATGLQSTDSAEEANLHLEAVNFTKNSGNEEEFTEDVSQMQTTESETADEDDTTSANGNTAKELGASENVNRDSELPSEKTRQSSTSTGDYSGGVHHESDEAHPAEHVSTHSYISTTPWPILLHGLTEIIGNTETDGSSYPEAEQQNTTQRSKSGDVLETESTSGANTSQDSEKQAASYDISGADERGSILLDSNAHNPAPSSENHEEEIEEFHKEFESEKTESTEASEVPQNSERKAAPVFVLRVSHDDPSDDSKRNSVKKTSSEHHEDRNEGADATTFSSRTETSESFVSVDVGISHSGSSMSEPEGNSDTAEVTGEGHSATTRTEATETTHKSEKKVSPVFVLRVSHDYPSDSREEPADGKDGESYSVRSSPIVVESPDGSIHGEKDKLASETNQLAQEVVDKTSYGDYHETSLGNSPKVLNSVAPVSPTEKDVITSESSNDVTTSSQSVQDVQNGDVGHLEGGQVSDTA